MYLNVPKHRLLLNTLEYLVKGYIRHQAHGTIAPKKDEYGHKTVILRRVRARCSHRSQFRLNKLWVNDTTTSFQPQQSFFPEFGS